MTIKKSAVSISLKTYSPTARRIQILSHAGAPPQPRNSHKSACLLAHHSFSDGGDSNQEPRRSYLRYGRFARINCKCMSVCLDSNQEPPRISSICRLRSEILQKC